MSTPSRRLLSQDSVPSEVSFGLHTAEFVSEDDRTRSPSVLLAESVSELNHAGCEDLNQLFSDCQLRRLTRWSSWAIECLNAIRATVPQKKLLPFPSNVSEGKLPTNMAALKLLFYQCSMDCGHFGDCMVDAQPSDDCVTMFLRYRAKLKLINAKFSVLEDTVGIDYAIPMKQRECLRLAEEMEREIPREKMDAYLWLLYGRLRYYLGQRSDALFSFAQAVRKLPHCFPAWIQLSKHVKSFSELEALVVPNHWMKALCKIEIFIHRDDSASMNPVFAKFAFPAFRTTPYFLTRMAEIKACTKGVSSAIEVYREIAETESDHMEGIGEYARALAVVNDEATLGELVKRIITNNIYSPEACTVLAYHYASGMKFREMYRSAASALSLKVNDPTYWILFADACAELQRMNAAYIAYHKAINLHRDKYKAWYSMGQVLHLLEYNALAFNSFRQAYMSRSGDSGVAMALGDEFTFLQNSDLAEFCYWKAYHRGDVDKISLLRLADLYSQRGEEKRAVSFYKTLIADSEPDSVSENAIIGRIFLYLTEYYFKTGDLKQAYWYAVKLLNSRQFSLQARALCLKVNEKIKEESSDSFIAEVDEPVDST